MSATALHREPTESVALEDELRWLRRLLAAEEPGEVPRPRERFPRLARLAEVFGLSSFETDVLLLAVGSELDGEVAEQIGRLTGGDVGAGLDPRPTFGLALARLPDGHWDAVSPERPLRQWRLLTLAAGPTLATRRLGVDEQVLHTLTGVAAGFGPLTGLVHHLPSTPTLADAHAEAAACAAASAAAGAHRHGRTLLRLVEGSEPVTRDVAAAVAAGLGARAVLVRTAGLPGPGPQLVELAVLLDRHLLLADAVPLLLGPPTTLAEQLRCAVVLAADDAQPADGRVELRHTVPALTPPQRRELWRAALGLDGLDELDELDIEVADAIDAVATRHAFDAATVHAVAAELATEPGPVTAAGLRARCRERGRVAMDGLAQRIEVRAGWDDLVLPEGVAAVLRALADHVEQRPTVHDRWGFAATSSRGLGVTALFSGPSGTGKTLAAEVLAGHLELDLHRVDLSSVVDKYIGETEKHLGRLFDAAERSGAVLLFDEADALFGRRTEVRDAHDRYANLEVSYLLQRMETYRGLAVLTTNLRSNVDRAFLRRLRFVVEFPFPDDRLRTRLWERAFPPQVPTERLDPAALARLRIPGGAIRAIAVAAAVAAAADGGPVTPRHIVDAARLEYAKADRTLTRSETAALLGGAP